MLVGVKGKTPGGKVEDHKLFLLINVGNSFFYHLPSIQHANLPFKPLFYHRSESESEAEEEEIPLLSEEEMNKLGAKLVKAEIMGNTVGLCCVNTQQFYCPAQRR